MCFFVKLCRIGVQLISEFTGCFLACFRWKGFFYNYYTLWKEHTPFSIILNNWTPAPSPSKRRCISLTLCRPVPGNGKFLFYFVTFSSYSNVDKTKNKKNKKQKIKRLGERTICPDNEFFFPEETKVQIINYHFLWVYSLKP